MKQERPAGGHENGQMPSQLQSDHESNAGADGHSWKMTETVSFYWFVAPTAPFKICTHYSFTQQEKKNFEICQSGIIIFTSFRQ